MKLILECDCGRTEKELSDDDEKYIPIPVLFCKDCKKQVNSNIED